MRLPTCSSPDLHKKIGNLPVLYIVLCRTRSKACMGRGGWKRSCVHVPICSGMQLAILSDDVSGNSSHSASDLV